MRRRLFNAGLEDRRGCEECLRFVLPAMSPSDASAWICWPTALVRLDRSAGSTTGTPRSVRGLRGDEVGCRKETRGRSCSECGSSLTAILTCPLAKAGSAEWIPSAQSRVLCSCQSKWHGVPVGSPRCPVSTVAPSLSHDPRRLALA